MTNKFDPDRLQELIEVLAGSRRGDKSQAAVRLEDCKPILDLPNKLQATTVTAAPTADQYNTLLKDVRSVSEALNAFALAIQRRQIR